MLCDQSCGAQLCVNALPPNQAHLQGFMAFFELHPQNPKVHCIFEPSPQDSSFYNAAVCNLAQNLPGKMSSTVPPRVRFTSIFALASAFVVLSSIT